jgi:methyl-accepting chemotaxis protein
MKLTFRARLYAGFALVIAVFLCVIGITVTKIEHARADVSAIREEAQKLQLANQWLANIRQNSARSLAVARSPGKDMLVFFKEPMAAVTVDTTKTQKAFLEATKRPTAKKLADKLGEVRTAWIATRDEINKLKDAGDDVGAAQLVDSRFVPITDQYIAAAQELVNGQVAEMDQLKTEIEDAFASLYKWLTVMTLLAILTAIFVSWRFGRSLVHALIDARASAEKIGHGDLVAQINSHSHDEVGQLMQSLEQARASLEKVILQTRQTSDNIQVAATEVATGNQDLAARTEAAASNLEQTASSMEEITATVRQSAEAAAQANQLAATATEVAQRGGAVVGQVVNTMDDINQSSRKIADIIGVIDSIAFQTNILALNAAVEAARAGEQGRGFAVVASEVRNLAGRSAQAAKEIKDLISASVDKVQTGSQLVQSAGSTMEEIVASVQRVTDVMAEITAAAAEQSNGIAQVNVAVTKLDQMTQQNAALVEQSSAAAESLRDQAHQLADVVSVFKVNGVVGQSRPSSAPAARPALPRAEPPKQIAAKPIAKSGGGQKSLKYESPAASLSPAPQPRPALKRPALTGSAVPAPKQAPAASTKVAKPAADNGDWETF